MKFERIVIFAAASAIAQATARRLAVPGVRMHIVGRDAQKLEAVRADLAARGVQVTSSVADLDDVSRHDALLDEAAQLMNGIDTALIAQGTLVDQAACEKDFALAEREWRTNFLGPASLATRLANRFEAANHGTLVVISSVAGDRGRRSNYVYGTAKAALSTFLEGLRGRMRGNGVDVITVKPGFVDTPLTSSFRKGPLWASPDQIARGIVRAMNAGTGEVYLPWFWWPIMFVIRHLPGFIFYRLKI